MPLHGIVLLPAAILCSYAVSDAVMVQSMPFATSEGRETITVYSHHCAIAFTMSGMCLGCTASTR